MKLTLSVVVISLLLCWTCLTLVLAGKQESFRATKNSHHHNKVVDEEEFDVDPRPKTHKFGLPKISADESISAHDFSHSDEKFHANREAVEYTQLASGNDAKIDTTLEKVERVLEDGKGTLENALNEHLGIQVPTKLIEGHKEELGLELIEIASSMLKDLIAKPRHASRLPPGIKSPLDIFGDRRQSNGKATSRARQSSGDSGQVLGTLLNLIEQLTKLGQDEKILQDPSFEKLLNRLETQIQGFRPMPTLRT